jgi:hypothetical protein
MPNACAMRLETDHLRRQPASELERVASEAARHETHWQEVSGQVDQVLDVVSVADLPDDVVENQPQVRRGGGCRAGIPEYWIRGYFESGEATTPSSTSASTTRVLGVIAELGRQHVTERRDCGRHSSSPM